MNEDIIAKQETMLRKLDSMDQKVALLTEKVDNIKLQQANADRKLDEALKLLNALLRNDSVLGARINKVIAAIPAATATTAAAPAASTATTAASATTEAAAV